jgi:hypothetical protein
MNRRPTSISLPDLSPAPGAHSLARLDGDMLFLQHESSLLALSLQGCQIAWRFTHTKPAPEHYCVPRRLRTSGRRIWSDDERVVHLFDTPDGARVQACRRVDGRALWHRDFVTPAPLPWTEPEPAWAGAWTEELDVFFAGGEALIVAVARSSRQTARWPDHAAPPLRSRLELTRIAPESGSTRWAVEIDEAHVPILEKRDLDLVLRAEDAVVSVDAATGTLRTHGDRRAGRGWPRRLARGIAVPWRARGKVGIDFFEARETRTVEWPHRRATSTKLRPLGDQNVMQVNEQFLAALGDDLRPRWETRLKTFIWGVASLAGGPLVAATCGAGGGLHLVDRTSGEVISERRTKEGAWDVIAAPAARRIIACCGEGLLIAEGSNGECRALELEGARVLVGTWGERVVVLKGKPAPGVEIVEVDS